MSRIIRHVTKASTVLIGERNHDVEAEGRAERTLGTLFPAVAVLTAPDGSKLIPIEEIFKVEEVYRSEIQKAHHAGFADGKRQGYEKGLHEGKEEARKVVASLNQAVSDAVTQREEMLQESRQKILDLVLLISRRVTFDAVDIDREATVGIIAGVIDQLVDRSRLKIKVHPDHLPIVEQHLDSFLPDNSTIKELVIEADPRVKIGGCFIETPSGDIDARLESQFEVIEGALRSAEDDS